MGQGKQRKSVGSRRIGKCDKDKSSHHLQDTLFVTIPVAELRDVASAPVGVYPPEGKKTSSFHSGKMLATNTSLLHIFINDSSLCIRSTIRQVS